MDCKKVVLRSFRPDEYDLKAKSRAGEPAYLLAAPAPDFFSSSSGSGSWFFSQAAPAPAPGIFFEQLRLRLQGAKKTGSGS